ncbi:MAG: GspE/PulE family protein [Acidithiobacillus sp.]
MIRELENLPPKPASIVDDVACVGSTIYVNKSKVLDSVLQSWFQRAKVSYPDLALEAVDPDVLIKWRAKERANRTGLSGSDTELLVEDATNLSRTRQYLKRMAELGASDLHLLLRDSYAEVQVRIKGQLRVLDKLTVGEGRILERTLFQGFAGSKDSSFRPMEFQNAQIDGEDVDPLLTGIRLVRGPCYPLEKGGSFVVGRLQYAASTRALRNAGRGQLALPARVPAEDLRLTDLGYTADQVQELQDMMESNSGIILVTGPTGSGKTTLQYELLKWHNHRFPELRQVTIEDPIEYPMPWAVQLSITNAHNEEATAEAFLERLRTALRMDPDTILVGEVRGAGSAMAALNAAMTGHLVLGTMHTNDPYMTIDRLELMDPIRLSRKITCDHRLIVGLVAQRLLPELCPHCSQPFQPDSVPLTVRHKLETWGDLSTFREKGPGCDFCGGDGYVSRSAVGEVVTTDSELMRVFIEEGSEAARNFMKNRAGFTGTILQNTMRLVSSGRVAPHDIRFATTLEKADR